MTVIEAALPYPWPARDQQAAAEADMALVSGDTKVVDRGKGDQMFINPFGVGLACEGVNAHRKRAAVGDKIIVSGEIAVQGIAIMSVREALELETEIASDTAPLDGLVETILAAVSDLHVQHDPTRGGLTSALSTIAEQANVGMRLTEAAIPISEAVKGACEILWLDPHYVTSDGKLLAVVALEHADAVLAAMRKHPRGRDAAIIGEVLDAHHGMVTMNTRVSDTRVVDRLSGEQLPLIC